MPAYSHTTRAAFRSLLASRLGDPGMTYWVQGELDLYIDETLRKWGLMTGQWRAHVEFPTTAGVALYDIESIASLTDYIGYSRTDRDEIGLMQYLLVEPYDPIDGTGMSDQFAFSSFAAALQRARDQFIADTALVASTGSVLVTPDTGHPQLSDSTITVLRAVWKSIDSVYSNLHLTDADESRAYSIACDLSPGTPQLFSRLAVAPREIDLTPPPADIGTIEYIGTFAGADLDPATPVILGIPDDTTWIVRMLALSDLLDREGPAYDPSRAAFCREQYRFGVALAASMTQLLAVEINSVPVIPSGLAEIDYGYADPHWQSTTGAPTDLGVVGGNILALRPVPDGIYSVGLDLVRKAVTPADDLAPIDVPAEDIDALLDGAESLARFKLGGASIDDAQRLFKEMIIGAVRHNSSLSSLGYGETLRRIPQLDEDSRPPYGSGGGTGALSPRGDPAASRRGNDQ